MIRVLVVPLLGLKYEGITSVILNYCANMDRSDMEISFIACNEVPDELRKCFENIGQLIYVPNRKKSMFLYIKSLNEILIQGKYDVIHIHGNSGTMALETLIAKKNKVKRVLVHCHNTRCNHPKLNKLLVPVMKKTADYYLGCSDAAGKWLYGNEKYIVLNNAVNLQNFRFDKKIRIECRAELKLGDEYVVGHVGHFTEQKNHSFLIDIFAYFHQAVPNSKLLLVSDGPLLEKVKNKVENLGLSRDVIFLGRRSDVWKLYQAMDLFLLPSLWEGLPVVMIEAQAAGLPVLASDHITGEAGCTSRTFYKSPGDSAVSWAQMISDIRKRNFDRSEAVDEEIRRHGFDIKTEAEKLRKIYLN